MRSADRRVRLIGIGAALGGLAGLVQVGATAGLDRYAARSWQPLTGTGWTLVTIPADPLILSPLIGLAASALVRRGRRREAMALGLALVAGFGVEIAGKEWIHQIHVVSRERVFDLFTLPGSFPSGHALRTVLLAATVWALWPTLRRLAVVWALAMLVTIEATGMHVPTEVLGGGLAGLGLLTATWPSRQPVTSVDRRLEGGQALQVPST